MTTLALPAAPAAAKAPKVSVPACIYSYGTRYPVPDEEKMIQQVRAGHEYHNKLIEIERNRREASNKKLMKLHPNVAKLEKKLQEVNEKIEAAETAVKQHNAKVRRIDVKDSTISEIATMRAQRKSLAEEFKAAKKLAWADPKLKKALESVEEEATEKVRDARARTTAYWGTYTDIEDRMKEARKGAPPKFRGKFKGLGSMSVQLQKDQNGDQGRAVRDIMDPEYLDRYLRLVHVSGTLYEVWLRIGSDEKRGPIWAKILTNIHRPLPEHARIKRVSALRRREGDQVKWFVNFELTSESGFRKHDAARKGVVHVTTDYHVKQDEAVFDDLGKSKIAPIHVASWKGNNGKEGSLDISAADVSRWKKADEIRAVNDVNFNVARDTLLAWTVGEPLPNSAKEYTDYLRRRNNADEKPHLEEYLKAWGGLQKGWAKIKLPEWFTDEIATLAKWRSPGRMAVLVTKWRDARFKGDETIFRAMEAWRRQSKHLYQWEVNMRSRAIRWRADTYRNFAAMLRREYKSVTLDLKGFGKILSKPEVGEGDAMQAARWSLRIASIGQLVGYLKENLEVKETKAT